MKSEHSFWKRLSHRWRRKKITVSLETCHNDGMSHVMKSMSHQEPYRVRSGSLQTVEWLPTEVHNKPQNAPHRHSATKNRVWEWSETRYLATSATNSHLYWIEWPHATGSFSSVLSLSLGPSGHDRFGSLHIVGSPGQVCPTFGGDSSLGVFGKRER